MADKIKKSAGQVGRLPKGHPLNKKPVKQLKPVKKAESKIEDKEQ